MSYVTLGLWPIAGITTVGVSESDARETILAAMDNGITHFDTAFSYGYDGQCDRLLGSLVRNQRERFTIIGKVGQRWTSDHRRVIDGSPETLSGDAETSLRRLGIDQFDILMLHSPDPNVPIERSAQAMDDLRRRGLCRATGVCNVDTALRLRFSSVARCDAIQCPLNLLQRASMEDLIPGCHADRCEVFVYWVLMKGLLAGRISTDHVFAEGDVRPTYEIFQGDARRRTHAVLSDMQGIADQSGMTIAQLSIGWALAQPGVTAALVGARRADQVKEIAGARPLEPAMVSAMDQIVTAHTGA